MDIPRFKVPKRVITNSFNARFIYVEDPQLWKSLNALLNLGIIAFDERSKCCYIPGKHTIGWLKKYPLVYIWSELVEIVE